MTTQERRAAYWAKKRAAKKRIQTVKKGGKITARDLAQIACPPQVRVFRELFPKGFVVTRENLDRAYRSAGTRADFLDLCWLVRHVCDRRTRRLMAALCPDYTVPNGTSWAGLRNRYAAKLLLASRWGLL